MYVCVHACIHTHTHTRLLERRELGILRGIYFIWGDGVRKKECASRVVYELEKERIISDLDKDKRNRKWLLFYSELRTMAKYQTDQRYKDHDRLSARAQKIVHVPDSVSPALCQGLWLQSAPGPLCGQPCLQFLLSAKSYVFSCDCSYRRVAHLVLSNENKQPVTVLTIETNKDI